MKPVFKWIKGICIGILGILMLLLIVGFIFEIISRRNAEKYSPTGQLVKIGNQQLHYFRQGQKGPTIVFESAFDPAGHLQWYHIQQKLPETFSSFSYDRAGILWSERGDNPKSGEKIAEELHQLLEKANIPKPYILVGHSFGGMLLRFFVNQYPKEVGGIILVDSQFPNDEKYLSPELYKMVNQGLPGGFLKIANTFGLARIMFRNMFPNTEEYRYQNSIMPALIHKSAYAVLEEQDEMEAIKKQASNINSFGSIPLTIISATDEKRFDSFIQEPKLRLEMAKAWDNMQKDLLCLSSDSQQILVPNSSHYINQDQPKVIEKAIQEMVEKISQ